MEPGQAGIQEVGMAEAAALGSSARSVRAPAGRGENGLSCEAGGVMLSGGGALWAWAGCRRRESGLARLALGA
jgi:hypothetical protein